MDFSQVPPQAYQVRYSDQGTLTLTYIRIRERRRSQGKTAHKLPMLGDFRVGKETEPYHISIRKFQANSELYIGFRYRPCLGQLFKLTYLVRINPIKQLIEEEISCVS